MDRDALAVRASLTLPERFGEIFERHHHAIWGYLARLAGPDVADDLTGEVFVVAFVQRDRFNPSQGQVRSWLYGIATNKLHNRFRSDSRAKRAFHRAAARRVDSGDYSQEVIDAADLADTVRRVRAAMALLDRGDRELIALAVWEQLPYAQIAVVLGVPVGTVRSRLSRARGRLRELMGPCGEHLVGPGNQESV